MRASNDSALALAGQLRSLTDAELRDLLEVREIREQGIRDFFDLADALLDAASIQQALGRLERPALTTLAALGELGAAGQSDAAAHLASLGADPAPIAAHLAAAMRLALVTEVGGLFAVPASVTAQLALWPSLGLPSLRELVSAPAPASLVAVSDTDFRFVDHTAAERAFATTTQIAELLAELKHESARQLARGGIALPDSKRLAASMGVGLERVPELFDIAARADLVVRDAGRWLPTAASAAWMIDTSGERWALLAGAWVDRLPSDIRSILGLRSHAVWGERLEEYVGWLFPAGGEWMRERVLVYTRDAELLGITANQVPSTPGALLLTDGAAPAAEAMVALLPAEVEKVYLQHDLSVVAPGPLAPPVDARLRTIADVEGRALASTYRISTASLYRALASGETAETIRDFLGAISLTGIPQPLDYLITEATGRYGLVRVGGLGNGRSYVSSTDGTLLRTMLVDHSLTALGLVRAANRLESRFEPDVVFWSLSDARYPVAAEDAHGQTVVLRRRQVPAAGAAAAAHPAQSLIEKLRLGSSADSDLTGAAWLSRQLDVAIRAKLALTVTVQLPDGSATDYQLEPSSVAGGRLRARDRRADIERTLPLASITAVGPAEL